MEKNTDKLRKIRRENRKKYRESRKELNISYTKEDFKNVCDNAALADLTPTEYIRERSLKHKVVPMDLNKKYTLAVKAEIRRIGINVNQIAKAINTQRDLIDTRAVNQTLERLTNEMRAVLKSLE